jgi:hypothetical protein
LLSWVSVTTPAAFEAVTGQVGSALISATRFVAIVVTVAPLATGST